MTEAPGSKRSVATMPPYHVSRRQLLEVLITGTLNSLSIETGDFISAFTEVAVVSNNGAFEVVSYVTEDDARRIAVGNEVMIDNTVKVLSLHRFCYRSSLKRLKFGLVLQKRQAALLMVNQ